MATVEQSAALFQAVGHPLRIRSLMAFRDSDNALSPRDLATVLGCDLGLVAYHVRIMLRAGIVRESHTKAVRGAMQHFYRLTPEGVELLVSVETLL